MLAGLCRALIGDAVDDPEPLLQAKPVPLVNMQS
jgi:hypothetical protein